MLFTVWSFLACATASVLAAPTPLVPVHRVARRASTGGYIVKFKDGAVNKSNRRKWIDNQLNIAGLDPLSTSQADSLKIGWRSDVFDGFAGQLSEDAVTAFSAHKDVEFIAEDGEAWVTAVTSQTDATWGLQRLSQQIPLNQFDEKGQDFTYKFDDSAGEGIDIYIVDTGVQVDHPEFEGRATFAQTFGSGQLGVDVHGHGTHVAGIAASKSFGVAKKANIVAVKVMADNGRGETSDIIAGVNFAVGQAFKGNRKKSSVINISIISDGTPALDAAVANAASLGIHVVVGAGNDGKDSADFSPARSPSAITVGATNIKDVKSGFSNIGDAVDIFAPGENILSTFPGGKTQILSGTSMATPFISGLVAYLIKLDGDTTPANMRSKIQGLGQQGVIVAVPDGTINDLAFNGAKDQAPSTTRPNAQPTTTAAAPPATSSSAPPPPFNDDQKQKVLSAAQGLVSMFQSLSDAAAKAAI